MIYVRAFAVETYRTGGYKPVPFAINDASSFAQTWTDIYGADLSMEVITDANATPQGIRATLRDLVGRVTNQDTVVIYYAGHGFISGNQSFLTGWDTPPDNPATNALAIDELFGIVGDLNARKKLFFIDACHSAFEFGVARSTIGKFSADELKISDKEMFPMACFAACSKDEWSFPHDSEKHGVWTYVLLKALRGGVPEILAEGHLLMAQALRDYLYEEVPPLVRSIYTSKVQRPRMWLSSHGDFIVADLSTLFNDEDDIGTSVSLDLSKGLAMSGTTAGRIQYLPGFKSGHTIPRQYDEYTQSFVENIGKDKVSELTKEIYQSMHESLKFPYTKMKLSSGGIITPCFDVSIDLQQSAEDYGDYDLTVTISDFVDPQILYSQEFLEVFRKHIKEFSFAFSRPINISKLLDLIESNNDYDDCYSFDPDENVVTISFEDPDLDVSISAMSLTLASSKVQPLSLLLENTEEIVADLDQDICELPLLARVTSD